MTSWPLWGTIVNMGSVLLGAVVGLALKALSRRFGKQTECPEGGKVVESSIASAVQKGLGLCVLIIGIMGAVAVQNMLVMIVSVVLGTLVGELLDLNGLLERLGALLERKMKGLGGNLAEGFVAATLLFCVGAMTVTGAMESGLLHTHDTYYAKSMLDMVSAVIFAFSLGVGVIFSAFGVLLVQGSLTMLAVLAGGAIPELIVAEMMAVGSLLVVGIGTNLLGVTRIKVMNMVPAMFFPIALFPLFSVIFA